MPDKFVDATTPSQNVSHLLVRIAAHDHGAFAALYRSVSPRIFSLTLRMLGNSESAEETLQDVFVTVWKRAPDFDPAKGLALHWIIRVARNKCLDRLRSRPREVSLDGVMLDHLPDTTPGPLDVAECTSDARALKYCLERLETGPREAILRVYYEGLTHAELAKHSSTPLGTLKTWIRRGLIQLKDCLDQ